MTSPARPPDSTEDRFLSFSIFMLAPAVFGLVLSLLSRADPGGSWWFFAGFVNFVGLFGLAGAFLVSVVLAALRRISLAVLLLSILQTGAVGLLAWFAARLLAHS